MTDIRRVRNPMILGEATDILSHMTDMLAIAYTSGFRQAYLGRYGSDPEWMDTDSAAEEITTCFAEWLEKDDE